jgi:mannose-6-phosphate isomerase-like protein (cupin superfamily)
MTRKIYSKLDDLQFIKTSHQFGQKKIIFNSSDFETNVMQLAYGKLLANQQIDNHMHETMEEIFIFISGTGIFNIDDIEFDIQKESIFRVPVKTQHNILALTDIEFYYFGVSLKN